MFRSADGWMFVMCQLPKFWTILVEKIGRSDLAADSRFASEAGRLANRTVLSDLLDSIFSTQPTAYWQTLLEGLVPIAPVHQLDQALDNPWLDTIGMTDTVKHPDREELKVLASPIRIDGKRLPNRAGPLLGADSDDILGALGYDAEAIAGLRAGGIV
jgi:crotonobetainyl-CoA:carnitine CoA-transferase CaiB-like acyl-CoA transferase